ncbi:hypothetical protein MKW98_009772 [Papaver atlanticum]|uniref:X8 domain-containing protein n=1 Tax=Papaver atlanticum TaxID=357466 RepID=A0AAD4XLH2_9MAGN|nr:hypothetical protein MKW98_009772 [Papaver atlanticum]
MTESNNLLWCIVLVGLLSSVSPTHAEDHNYDTKKQPSATPSIKFPPPAYSYNNTSPTSTIKDEDLETTYCVAKSFGANMDSMAAALSWTCGVVDCSILQPGSPCFEPDSLAAHASFAFNLYYQKNNRMNGSCDFNGTAMITSTNPSHGTCMFTNHNPRFMRSASRLQYGGVILALGVLVGVVFGL